MASIGSKNTITIGAANATDHIRLAPGRYGVNLKCESSTLRLEGKHYTEDDTEFSTITLPDGNLTTSTDSFFEIGGGYDLRIFVTAYSATPGKAVFNLVSDPSSLH